LVTTLLGLLFGGVYAHLASTSYRSSALLLLDAHPLIWETGTPKGNELQISQQEFVSSVMAAQDLYHLKCFDDFSAEQALKATLRNMGKFQLFSRGRCTDDPRSFSSKLQEGIDQYQGLLGSVVPGANARFRHPSQTQGCC